MLVRFVFCPSQMSSDPVRQLRLTEFSARHIHDRLNGIDLIHVEFKTVQVKKK